MSKELTECRLILKRIQYATNKTIEEIARDIGYSRAYLNAEVNKGTNMEIKNKLLDYETTLLPTSEISPEPIMREGSIENKDVLTKYVSLLERIVGEKEERINSLLAINTELQNRIQANVTTVLNNQLAHTSLLEALINAVSVQFLELDEQRAREFRVNLHREAIQRLMVLRKTGNSLQIDTADIVSVQS